MTVDTLLQQQDEEQVGFQTNTFLPLIYVKNQRYPLLGKSPRVFEARFPYPQQGDETFSLQMKESDWLSRFPGIDPSGCWLTKDPTLNADDHVFYMVVSPAWLDCQIKYHDPANPGGKIRIGIEPLNLIPDAAVMPQLIPSQSMSAKTHFCVASTLMDALLLTRSFIGHYKQKTVLLTRGREISDRSRSIPRPKASANPANQGYGPKPLPLMLSGVESNTEEPASTANHWCVLGFTISKVQLMKLKGDRKVVHPSGTFS